VGPVLHFVPAIPPAAALGLLVVLIGTQVAYLIAPARAGYLLRLAVSVAAVAGGEVASMTGLGAQLPVGDLHPYQDIALLALGQWSLTRWRRRAQPAGGVPEMAARDERGLATRRVR
jgi:hypothetical protein